MRRKQETKLAVIQGVGIFFDADPAQITTYMNCRGILYAQKRNG